MSYQLVKAFIRRAGIAFLPAIAAFALVTFTPPVCSGENPDKKGEWEFQVAPYMWALSLDGDITVKGQKSDLDVDFSDIWDQLNMAGMLAFEGRKGNWGFFGDAIYADLGDETKVDGIRIDPDMELMMITLGGFYRLGTWDASNAPGGKAPTVTVDALVGGRYTYLDMELDIKGPFGKLDPQGDQDWFDPFVGIRTIWDFSERWSLSLDGGVGGFGVGSDFAWHACGVIGYRFSLFGKNNARVVAGYRALSMDYTNGSGNKKFEWDVTMHGPIIGLVIQF